jgi:two-component system sensor histidine kinase UhpB
LGQPIGGGPDVEALRRAIDVMGEHIEQAQVGAQQYVAALTNAQEAERERVARELHDDTVQRLIALGQAIERAQRALDRGDAALAGERLRTLRSDITGTVQALRTIIADLRPPALEDLGLIAAIELFLQRSGATPHATISAEGSERRLDEASEIALFRIVQEAWSNIQRHANATHVRITLRYERGALHVEIVDDGRGFVPAPGDTSPPGKFGLRGMHERASLVGGTVQIRSAPEQGTQIHVRMPYPGVAGRDPICNMVVGPDAISATYNGQIYRFCSHACRDLFQAEPARYVG